jgi:hypothetical protein
MDYRPLFFGPLFGGRPPRFAPVGVPDKFMRGNADCLMEANGIPAGIGANGFMGAIGFPGIGIRVAICTGVCAVPPAALRCGFATATCLSIARIWRSAGRPVVSTVFDLVRSGTAPPGVANRRVAFSWLAVRDSFFRSVKDSDLVGFILSPGG